MEKVVVDASVIVKWFVDEIYSENARKKRIRKRKLGDNRSRTHALRSSQRPEVYKFNKHELVMVAKALTLYGFRLFPLIGKLAERTAELDMEKDVTVYDASYVALAEDQDARFYTADEKLKN